MSAQNTFMTAVKASERGAYEYLPKPFDLQELISIVGRALSQPGKPMAAGNDQGEDMPLVGRSPAMQDIYRVLARLMQTDLTVMINGESGTGKELVARALHDFGRRKRGPFVAINMAAIPKDLIEAELFGHEKGAFTGAGQRGVGRFEQAEGGTLFLDEIGDMPMEAQTRLLRVLQQGEYTTVGGRELIKTDVRIVAATNKDLFTLIRAGLFREDLYYRLNVVPIKLPPLRERMADVADLARHFLVMAEKEGLPRKSIDQEALDRLQAHNWPGNVRELENVIRRVVALTPQDTITAAVIDAAIQPPPSAEPIAADRRGAAAGGPPPDSLSEMVERHLAVAFAQHHPDLPPNGLYDRILREVETPLITGILHATRGNQVQAAQVLGINPEHAAQENRRPGYQGLSRHALTQVPLCVFGSRCSWRGRAKRCFDPVFDLPMAGLRSMSAEPPEFRIFVAVAYCRSAGRPPDFHYVAE